MYTALLMHCLFHPTVHDKEPVETTGVCEGTGRGASHPHSPFLPREDRLGAVGGTQSEAAIQAKNRTCSCL